MTIDKIILGMLVVAAADASNEVQEGIELDRGFGYWPEVSKRQEDILMAADMVHDMFESEFTDDDWVHPGADWDFSMPIQGGA